MEEIKVCLIVMGNTKGVIHELDEVAIDTPSFINAEGIFITTFTTDKTINEIKIYFKIKKRNFLMFEINDETSAYHFLNKTLESGIFSFVENKKDDIFENFEVLKNDEVDSKLTEKSILKMTKEEKENKLNELIDKGIENLSDEEKQILNLLVL